MVADLGRHLFRLFQHPSTAIVKGAGLLMRTIIEEAPPAILERMQALALSEGAFLSHLNTALFTDSSQARLATNRELSRTLLALWTGDNPAAMNLLQRAIPKGLVVYLDSNESPPEYVQRTHCLNIGIQHLCLGIGLRRPGCT